MSEPVLLAPLRIEACSVRLGTRSTRTRVERIGMGRACATWASSRLAASLRDFEPVAVLGVAGGLAEDARAGDVVVASEVRVANGSTEPTVLEAGLVERLVSELSRSLPRVRLGPVVCAERMVSDSERAELARSGALAVEMESAWLAPLAAGRHFAVVRVVADLPGHRIVSARTVTGGVAALLRLSTVSRIVAETLSSAAAPVPAHAPVPAAAPIPAAAPVPAHAPVPAAAPVPAHAPVPAAAPIPAHSDR